MEQYIQQLLNDIDYATQNINWPYIEKEMSLHEWIAEEDDDATAPIRNLPRWTGITPLMLPPVIQLTDDQVTKVLGALKKLLDECNCCFVLQIEVPERVQYETIRHNFDQDVKVKQWHTGFFEMCKPDTVHNTCALGEYCQCAFYAELFSGFIDEELTPDEERARALEIEVAHIKRKYDDDWIKYYPYHLDKNYDDENGNPYNHGFDDAEEDDQEDNWWCK
jgi:hypothetical protein